MQAPSDGHTNFNATRLEELQAENAVIAAALESSRQREAALHRSIDGYRTLLEDVKAKRDALQAECDGQRRVVESMTDKVSALLSENESLRVQQRRLEQVTTVTPSTADDTASSSFNAPAKARQAASAGGAWASDPSQMATTIASLETEVGLLREQLRHRTTALNDALGIIHAISTTTRPPVAAFETSTIALAASYAASHQRGGTAVFAGNDANGPASHLFGGRSTVREKAELQVRIKELEFELQRAQKRAPRPTSMGTRL